MSSQHGITNRAAVVAAGGKWETRSVFQGGEATVFSTAVGRSKFFRRPVPQRAVWPHGVGESFNGKFRDECLNQNWFVDVREARQVIETCQHRAAAQRLNCLSHPRGQPRATSNGLEHFGEDGREGFAVVTWNDGMQVSIEILP
jgi:hypothetical protein